MLNQKVEFLKSLQPETTTCFGVKSRDRKLDPDMKAIFSWGYEAPVKQDYTKNEADITNKIRKTKREDVSEAHDNFRKPEKGGDRDTLLFNYFESDQMELLKKRICQMHEEKERAQRNKSSYKEQYCLKASQAGPKQGKSKRD